ncbi:MAG TPA: hypothetical protein VF269_06035 [Rhodanobacteraceae bacterium]
MTHATSNTRVASFLAINTLLLACLIIVLALMVGHAIDGVLAAIVMLVVVLAMGANQGAWWTRIRRARGKVGP